MSKLISNVKVALTANPTAKITRTGLVLDGETLISWKSSVFDSGVFIGIDGNESETVENETPVAVVQPTETAVLEPDVVEETTTIEEAPVEAPIEEVPVEESAPEPRKRSSRKKESAE